MSRSVELPLMCYMFLMLMFRVNGVQSTCIVALEISKMQIPKVFCKILCRHVNEVFLISDLEFLCTQLKLC